MEAKYKAQLGELQSNLEKEREQAEMCAGDNSAMKCKIALLEDQLEDLKKENQDVKGKLAEEKIANAREVNFQIDINNRNTKLLQLAEKDAENSKLKNLLPEWAKAGVNGTSHLGGSGCVNNLPVDLAQELGVYRKILDAVGEEKEKERVEEVCKRC